VDAVLLDVDLDRVVAPRRDDDRHRLAGVVEVDRVVAVGPPEPRGDPPALTVGACAPIPVLAATAKPVSISSPSKGRIVSSKASSLVEVYP